MKIDKVLTSVLFMALALPGALAQASAHSLNKSYPPVINSVSWVDLTQPDANRIQASGENSQFNVGKLQLFDNQTNTKWLTFQPQGWVSYRFDSATSVHGYSLTSANDVSSRDPVAWELQGSNNGSSWQTLDSRQSVSFNQRFERKEFSLSVPQSYQFYRLSVNQNAGANILQLAEMELLAPDNSDYNLPFNKSGQLNQGQWLHLGPFQPKQELSINTRGSGDVDLFVKAGSQPNSQQYDCRSNGPSSIENCKITGNAIYVSLYGYRASQYQLSVKNSTLNPTLPFSDSASLIRGQWQYYGPFDSTKTIVATTSGSGDADLYLRL